MCRFLLRDIHMPDIWAGCGLPAVGATLHPTLFGVHDIDVPFWKGASAKNLAGIWDKNRDGVIRGNDVASHGPPVLLRDRKHLSIPFSLKKYLIILSK